MEGNPIVQKIMDSILEHIKPVINHGAGGNIHHYNRVYEKISEWIGATRTSTLVTKNPAVLEYKLRDETNVSKKIKGIYEGKILELEGKKYKVVMKKPQYLKLKLQANK